jgi:hypothetical protein
VNGVKEILNPPDEYVKKTIDAGFEMDPDAEINVDDRSGLTHLKQWCTKVP